MDFHVLAQRLRAGKLNAEREFVDACRPGVELILVRRMPHRAAREVAERLLWRAVGAVRSGMIAEAAELVRFVHSTAATCADGARDDLRPEEPPGEEIVSRQQVEVLRKLLAQTTERDMEALRRFYVNGESLADVLDSMNVPAEDFCRLKARLRAASIAGERRQVTSAGRRLVRRMAAS